MRTERQSGDQSPHSKASGPSSFVPHPSSLDVLSAVLDELGLDHDAYGDDPMADVLAAGTHGLPGLEEIDGRFARDGWLEGT
jgi:hypothetical protein